MDNIKLGFNKENSTFVSDPQNGTCKYEMMCHLSIPKQIAGTITKRFVRRHMPVVCSIFTDSLTGKMSAYFWIEGTSKCHEGDTFSEELGYRIAQNKAKRNAYRAVHRLTAAIAYRTAQNAMSLQDTINHLDFLEDDSTNHINYIVEQSVK